MSSAHGGHKHGIPIYMRLYAAIPIIVVLYLSYSAIHYLVMELMVPRKPPQQVTGIPVRLTEEVWQTQPSQFMGIQVAESPRAPLSHYHRIDGWFQPDRQNDCTRSGCHNALPHNANKEVRAFLNMHATSIHCSVCHLESSRTPLPLVWYDLADGDVASPPALLQVYGWLNSPEGAAALEAPTAAVQDRLVGLLQTAAAQSGYDPALERMVADVSAVSYASYLFVDAAERVRARLRMHLRGEYGAKLALRDPTSGQPILAHEGADEATRALLRLDDDADPARRAELIAAAHPAQRAESLDCVACHTADHPLVDLAAVGYPPVRLAELQQGWVFRAIQHMRDGQSFVMPQFIGTGSGGGGEAPLPLPRGEQE